MKKLINITLVLTVISISILIAFAAIKTYQGENVTAYFRFQKIENGVKKFNFWGIPSPVTIESQNILKDTNNFTMKVEYPVAPKFNLVEPRNYREKAVADTLARIIRDSINADKVKYLLNYDGQSAAVRKAAAPSSPKFEHYNVLIKSAKGTASPEAAKYGFENSIQIGHYEGENLNLAEKRLARTIFFLRKELKGYGIKIPNKISMKSEELQLKDQKQVEEVIKNHALLDNMRYVEVNVSIISERLQVTTITSPILLLFELLGLLKLIQLLWAAFSKARLPKFEEPITFKKIDWKKFWYNFGTGLLLILAILIAYIMGLMYIPILLILLIIVCLIIIWYMILRRLYLIPKVKMPWKKSWCFIIFISIIMFFENLYYWWQSRTLCQKILLIHFILDIVIAIAIWMNWIIICKFFWW